MRHPDTGGGGGAGTEGQFRPAEERHASEAEAHTKLNGNAPKLSSANGSTLDRGAWASHTANPSPEAHADCYAAALSEALSVGGFDPERLSVSVSELPA